MSDNVQTAIFDILRKIQEDNASFKRSVEGRLDRIEELMRKQRRDAAGMLVMMKATAGDFEERVTAIEERMDRFDALRS
jgi:hypothetical protein